MNGARRRERQLARALGQPVSEPQYWFDRVMDEIWRDETPMRMCHPQAVSCSHALVLASEVGVARVITPAEFISRWQTEVVATDPVPRGLQLVTAPTDSIADLPLTA